MSLPSSSSLDNPDFSERPSALAQQRAKSPPLAFEKTPNDSLLPLNTPPPLDSEPAADGVNSPSQAMGRLSPFSGGTLDLQAIVDQQTNAIQLLHEAFAAERQVWSLEKDRLYQRIASLETLLKSGDHWSPAKSPVLSPTNENKITSPLSRATSSSQKLPTIAEDDANVPLSPRPRRSSSAGRGSPNLASPDQSSQHEHGTVTFTDGAGVRNQMIPPIDTRSLSPPPPNNRMLAGHTPIRINRPPTPPPQELNMDGIDDTPTRNNTHINALLTQSSDEEDDYELRGPLNMPELPNRPDEFNFTLDMLSKRLEHIEKHPEEGTPQVIAEPSPCLASPVNELDLEQVSPKNTNFDSEDPIAPVSTVTAAMSYSEKNSNSLSSAVISPSSASKSPLESREAQVQHEFEQGGIKLKKKPSVNFGAPLGQLGGFSSIRKLS